MAVSRAEVFFKFNESLRRRSTSHGSHLALHTLKQFFNCYELIKSTSLSMSSICSLDHSYTLKVRKKINKMINKTVIYTSKQCNSNFLVGLIFTFYRINLVISIPKNNRMIKLKPWIINFYPKHELLEKTIL